MKRIRAFVIRAGRYLLGRFPGIARGRWGRAIIAAAREILQPAQASPWRSAPVLSRPEVTTDASTIADSSKTVKVKDPDEIATETSPLIRPRLGCEARIVLCCAFTGRHDVLHQVILESLGCGTDVRWMLCGSTPEDEEFIRLVSNQTGIVAGFTCENETLGRKWQSCMVRAGEVFDAASYGIVGSDDFVSRRLLDHVSATVEVAEMAPDLICTLEWMVWLRQREHPLSPNIFRCHYAADSAFQPLGAGRFYGRGFLERCDFRIFDSRLNRLLDDRGFEEIRDRGGSVVYFSIEDGPLLSLKGDWLQMNAIEGFLDAPTLDVEEFSIEGFDLLRRSLGPVAMQYLARPTAFTPQFHFARIDSGLRED